MSYTIQMTIHWTEMLYWFAVLFVVFNVQTFFFSGAEFDPVFKIFSE